LNQWVLNYLKINNEILCIKYKGNKTEKNNIKIFCDFFIFFDLYIFKKRILSKDG